MAYLVARQCIEEGGGPLRAMSTEDKEKLAALEAALKECGPPPPAPLPAVMAVADHQGPLAPTVMPDDPDRTPIPPRFLTVLEGLPVEPVVTLSRRQLRRRSARPLIGQ